MNLVGAIQGTSNRGWEALRDDESFAHTAVWEFEGDGKAPNRHQEKLTYDNVKLAVRSYK